MAGKIFINYRRDDSIGTAGRLRDRLVEEFGRNSLFMDVENIPAGVDFVAHLNAQVDACGVFLAVIGPNWLNARDGSGCRRLDDPDDFVAVEIAAALSRNIRVIPVLIDGARLPKSDELPDLLKPLVRRNAVEVRNAQFGRDSSVLVKHVREALKFKRAKALRLAAVAAALLFLAGWIGLYQIGVQSWAPWALRGSGQNARGTGEIKTDADAKSNVTLAPSALHDMLLAQMAAYSVAESDRASQARNFVGDQIHRAIAVSINAKKTFRTSRWLTSEVAEIGALEGCQLQYGNPCVLLALDERIMPANDPPVVRDMPRARYAGLFDPEQIPRARPELLRRTDVAGYRSAPTPKAAAFHPNGLLFIVVGGSGQFEAEELALSQCNDDPVRKGTGGPCFLYAVGDQVVLPQRSVKPLSKAPSGNK